jgi:HEAT repeat protein
MPVTAGCGAPRTPYPASLQSEDPGDRVRALKRAAELNDRDVLGIIVDRLEDEDEAVRLFAILALERMTGTRLGYRYHAPASERTRMAAAWRNYLREHGTRLASGSEGQRHE